MSQQIIRQIKAILDGNDLNWTERDGVVALRFASAVVTMTLVPWGSQNVIQLQANVLRGLNESSEGSVLREVNALNCESFFGKWSYYADEDTLAVEYDLLADHMQEAELMTALASVARAADYHDDLLQQRLGGHRAIE